MPYPIIWTPCSSRKSPPVVSWQKRPCPPHCCPAQTAPPLRPPTLTAITASCLRWDQSGVSTNCCARVLFSHLLFALLWSQLVLFSHLSISLNFPKMSMSNFFSGKCCVLNTGYYLFPLPEYWLMFSFPRTGCCLKGCLSLDNDWLLWGWGLLACFVWLGRDYQRQTYTSGLLC